MKKTVYRILLVAALFCATEVQAQAPAKLFAGAAEAVINPPIGTYLAGYGQNRKSTGVHDNLFVKAVVVTNLTNAIAIVAIDCIGLPYNIVQQIRNAIEAKIPSAELNAGHIIVSSTHTHAGADVIGIYGQDMAHTGVDSAYMRFLVNSAAGTIIKAGKNKQAVSVKYALTGFGEGWVENVSDSAEIDRSVTVLQFVNARGKSIATFTNFACHPTFSDGKNTLVSADYPAGLYKALNTALGGINIFLQGSIGGWVQPENTARTFEAAIDKGKGLGSAVLVALKQPNTIQGSSIYFSSRQFEMPVKNTTFRQLAAADIIRRDISDGTPTEIAWFSIGNAVFATHPGETSPLFGLATKKLMRNTGPKFVLGLGMDQLGYILKKDFFDPQTSLHAAAYLTAMSPGEEAGYVMMDILEQLAEENQ